MFGLSSRESVDKPLAVQPCFAPTSRRRAEALSTVGAPLREPSWLHRRLPRRLGDWGCACDPFGGLVSHSFSSNRRCELQQYCLVRTLCRLRSLCCVYISETARSRATNSQTHPGTGTRGSLACQPNPSFSTPTSANKRASPPLSPPTLTTSHSHHRSAAAAAV